MATFLATTTISIFDDTASEDQFGDPTDNGTLQASGVPASLLERSSTFYNATNDRYETTRNYAGIVQPSVDVREGWTVVDETDGAHYFVDHVKSTNGGWGLPRRLTCRRVDY